MCSTGQLQAQGTTQTFGQNRVQYKTFEWSFFESEHFTTYFYLGGQDLGKYTIIYAEKTLEEIEKNGLSEEINVVETGCMGPCELGPVMVVYPEAVWYTYIDKEDVEEIIQEHLIHGRVVDRLRI